MVLLLLGLAIFVGIHLVKSLAVEQRTALVAKHGEGRWRLAVTVVVILSTVLMVRGYRWTGYEWGSLYYPAPWGWHINNLLMLFAFILFGAGHGKSNLRRFIRHPMLASVALWSLAHLLANGETRAVVFFGTMGLWAIAEMLLINRRDGAWSPPPPSPRSADIRHLLISAVLFIAFALIHPWLFGVSPFPV